VSVKEGGRAPAFSLPAADGRMISLDELRRQGWVVLYFYPKDDTPGCTKEACAFRDMNAMFARVGAVIVGVSPDKTASHQKFQQKYALPFLLLSDEGAKVAAAYGVWKKKSLYGREYMGIERTTFLITPAGRIARIYPKVKVDGHADALLADLKAAKTG